MIVHLLDYGAGNVASLVNALTIKLNLTVLPANTPEQIRQATVLFFPGVGSFAHCVKRLQQMKLVEPLLAHLRANKPFLGICLGMQTLFDASDESPGAKGLGFFPGTVGRFCVGAHGLTVPQMGWNGVAAAIAHPMFASLADGDAVYFVHSFRVALSDALADSVMCETAYGERFVSGVCRGRVCAVQFHPEKSGPVGLAMLRGFLDAAAAPPPPTASPTPPSGALLKLPLHTMSSNVCKRVVACLDVRANDAGDLVVTKGDQYDVRETSQTGDVRNLGKPVALAQRYYDEGADEVTFLNITGFRECPLGDLPMLAVLAEVSKTCFVPLCVGGGIRKMAAADGSGYSALDVADAYFRAGADKVSIGSDAVEAARAWIASGGRADGTSSLEQIADKYGRQAVVVSIDPRRVWVASHAAADGHACANHSSGAGAGLGRGETGPNGETLCWYECTVQGGRKGSGLDVVEVARAVEALGAGELLVNCIDCDGQHAGFDLPLMAMLRSAVGVPIIASSGAGSAQHFVDVFNATGVEAALAASIFHRRLVPIATVKRTLADAAIAVRAVGGGGKSSWGRGALASAALVVAAAAAALAVALARRQSR